MRRGYLVYILVDPRTGVPFYVGITRNPLNRWHGHHGDPASAVYGIMRELREAGLKCRVRIVATELDRDEALSVEAEYIQRHAETVLNTSGHPSRRPRFRGIGEEMRRENREAVSEEIEAAARAIHIERYSRDLWDGPGMSEAARQSYRREAAVAIRTAEAYREKRKED